jgi:hypothetical protein
MRCVLPVLVLLMAGCQGSMARARTDFEDARYPQAVRGFDRLEARALRFSQPERAEYALYRGLSHLALGDARLAARWLGYAKAELDRDPRVFDAEERGRLLAAWRSMGHMPGEPGEPVH